MKTILLLSIATSLLLGCPPQTNTPDGLDSATDASTIDDSEAGTPDEPIAPDVQLAMDARADF